jgi:hypothetical protein
MRPAHQPTERKADENCCEWLPLDRTAKGIFEPRGGLPCDDRRIGYLRSTVASLTHQILRRSMDLVSHALGLRFRIAQNAPETFLRFACAVLDRIGDTGLVHDLSPSL